MSAVLVTGATGFLGTSLLPRLAVDRDVIALYRPGGNPAPADGVRWIAQDLTAPLSTQLPRHIDAVIHAAQSRRFREFPDGAVDIFEVNAAATVRLLDYCRNAGGSTFAYVSSGAVYRSGAAPLQESDTPQPGSFYGASKLAGELAVEQYRRDLRGHVLRMFFIYGPGQQNMFIPNLVSAVRDGREVALAGPDGIRVNPTYVDDAASAVIATLDCETPQTLNVAGPDVVSVREVAEQAGELLGRAPRFKVGGAQANFVAATDALQASLGAPGIGFREGLSRTVRAELKHVA